MLISRVLDHGKQRLQDVATASLYRKLSIRPRAPRTLPSIANLPEHETLVVVAHPDDEVVAAGALLARAQSVGVIYVTDGAPRRGSHARDAGFSNWPDYAHARRREAEAALAILQRDFALVQNLGIADQDAVFNLVATTCCLVEKIRSGFSHIVTHAYEGGHPDHDATAFCVHAACALIAQEGDVAPHIVEAPLYIAPDGRYVYSRFLTDADAGPITVCKLTPAEQARKRRMFDCHVTQKAVFDSFRLDQEMFRLAPRYHFSVPPHAGEVGFDQFKWPLTGQVWRTHARRAMRELGVLEEMA